MKKQQLKKKPPVISPPPAPPCGRLFPDPTLTNIKTVIYPNQMLLSFDPIVLTPGDMVGYALYYLIDPQPATWGNGVVQIDGLFYKQVTANYYTLPMYINFGWSPMYLNVIYTCRMGIYSSGGCYQYSKSFTINTSLV